MTRNLALDAIRVTEAAAVGAYAHMGQGDEEAADRAAVAAVSLSLGRLSVGGCVRIGEGIENDVPDLYTGQKVGNGEGPEVDIALMPLEGTSIMARGGFNAISAVAFAESGGFLSVPAVYMEKISVGSSLPADVIDIDATPQDNISNLAAEKNLKPTDLVICILDRPRHKDLIEDVRTTGAGIRLIMDGDLSGAVAPVHAESGIDMYMGIGLAPQGILTAAALKCSGGQFQGRLIARNSDDKDSLFRAGIEDASAIYTLETMISGDVVFAATGITTGLLLPGVERSRYRHDGYTFTTHSMVLSSQSGTWREVQSHHHSSGMSLSIP